MNAASPAPEPSTVPPAAPPAGEPMPRTTFFRWRRRVRIMKEVSAGFDLRWVIWTAVLLAGSCGLWAAPNVTVQTVVTWTLVTSALLMALYFGHILFFRLQCSLLEFCVIIAALGNLEGMLLTTPGIFSVGRDWVMVLAPLGVAWLFYGAVIGLVQAELSGRRSAPARLFHIVAGWLSTGSLAMLGLGAILWFGRHETRLITKNLSVWGLPLLIAGAIGLALGFRYGRAAKRAAKERVYNS